MLIYPSEELEVKRAIHSAIESFKGSEASKLGITVMAGRIQDAVYRAGFHCLVNTDPMDPGNYDLIGKDQLVFIPQVNLTGRVDGKTETDFDRMQFDAKSGTRESSEYKALTKDGVGISSEVNPGEALTA